MVVPGSRSAELSLSQTKVKIAVLQECKLVPTVVTLLYLKEKKHKNKPTTKTPPKLFKTYSARHVSVYYKCQTGRIILPMF